MDVPVCIDSSVLGGGRGRRAEAATGKPLVNSVTGEEERLEAALPRGRAWRGRASPSTTTRPVFPTIRERFKIAKKIVERAESYGIPRTC